MNMESGLTDSKETVRISTFDSKYAANYDPG